MEDGLAEAVSAISECEAAITEILKVGDAISGGEKPLRFMVDPDASNPDGLLEQDDATAQ